MTIWWKSQEKDTYCWVITILKNKFLEAYFYKTNEAIVAEIYQFLRFI